jgi:hypothetical protein
MSMLAGVICFVAGGLLESFTSRYLMRKKREAAIMAHKYRVELSKEGYGGKKSYAFFADSIEWRDSNTLDVRAGAAWWPIHNVLRCTNVTTGRPVDMPTIKPKPVVKTEPRTTITKAERRLLHRLLSCHVTGQVLKDAGLKDLQLRLKEEFGMYGGMELVRPKNGYQQVLS